jgi:hypothetical protein
MQRRIESGVVILTGIALIAVLFVAQLFTRAPAFERVTDDFRVAMTDGAMAQMQEDLMTTEAMSVQMTEQMVPELATSMGMTPEEFSAFAETSFPAFSTGMTQLPEITATFQGLGADMAAQQENFEAADAIPTKDLPATTIPWAVLAVALIAIGAGVLMLWSKTGSYVAIALGLVTIAGIVAFSLVDKAGKADDMNSGFRPIMTEEGVAGAQNSLAVVNDMSFEMQETMLPALAEQMGTSTDELTASIATQYPDVGAGMEAMPGMLERFDGMVSTMSGSLDDYLTIEPLSLSPIVWILMWAGVVIAAIGALSLFAPAPVLRGRPVSAH